ncbi:HAD superfamily hydrolase (TIGR01509 family) [Lipingzhangella halophila]|uniref:HAD superfamily hydrolase (TIGR01509 family) n=1 Tax=Lipingzhangella halophila TaxID=1783352 RepID=A0A7W7RMM4_9ACTN|nr:HAD family phosphatase [Lipingzhangella halophila]MBB4934805.1 HAD superfamily hydrolase (TIGR01509 family) [Lipingzhangella halophila]
MSSRLHAVVFDLDGVLVESDHLWEEMWSGYAARHGVQWESEDTATVQGMSSSEWSHYLNRRAGAAESDEDTERAVVDGMVEAFEQERVELLAGARETVAAVSAEVPIALASSAPRRLIDAVLRGHGLADHFTATVSSAEVGRGKPHPDVYLEAAARIGQEGGDCAAVEDSSNGIRAAHAAKMTVVALPNPAPGYRPAPDALALAAEEARDLADVSERLLRLLARPAAQGSS